MKKVIVCLDIKDGRTTKGIKFKDNIDIGDPVAMAEEYCKQGADEVVLYDIMASAENRGPSLELIRQVAAVIDVPLVVGGGISSAKQVGEILKAGAAKVSINSPAVKKPSLINEIAAQFGRAVFVLGVDANVNEKMPSGYEITIDGNRVKTGRDLIEWIKEAEERGASEIVLNSIQEDGMRNGYDCKLTKLVAESTALPVIASGGAGAPKHLLEALTDGKATTALVASIVHSGEYTVSALKKYLRENGVQVSI